MPPGATKEAVATPRASDTAALVEPANENTRVSPASGAPPSAVKVAVAVNTVEALARMSAGMAMLVLRRTAVTAAVA